MINLLSGRVHAGGVNVGKGQKGKCCKMSDILANDNYYLIFLKLCAYIEMYMIAGHHEGEF